MNSNPSPVRKHCVNKNVKIIEFIYTSFMINWPVWKIASLWWACSEDSLEFKGSGWTHNRTGFGTNVSNLLQKYNIKITSTQLSMCLCQIAYLIGILVFVNTSTHNYLIQFHYRWLCTVISCKIYEMHMLVIPKLFNKFA